MTAPQPTPTGQSVSVGRLTLHAGNLSDAQARRLAELVALALGRMPVRSAQTVTVGMPAPAANSVEQIADAVAHAIEQALIVEGAR
jgi:hypothetical protein